ncbi:TRAP transporter substrate-binding protein [Zobellella maritima]|uniref:TRAP transporter substrate-binding protein n=1 Tax=Zobellella maritima TaxID=2059725 RepID=UPI000E2FF87A|nr:TRAP transporter substrate-binding protein [Zobellella maritima]
MRLKQGLRAWGVATLCLATLISTEAAARIKPFKMALGDGAGSPQHVMGQRFVELLEQKTGGRHGTLMFLNGQLGDEQSTINDASMGLVDFTMVAINNVTPFSPSVGVLTLPYMMQSLDDAITLTQGEVGRQLIANTVRDANIRIIGWTYTGFRVLTNARRPVHRLSDLTGLKVRVPANDIMIDTYRAWGINPTPMAWSETFTGLQLGVVDGQDNPYMTIHAMKFSEVQDYITNIRYLFSIEPLIVSEEIYQAQSDELQQAIRAAGQEATAFSARYLVEQEDKIRAELVSQGMAIIEPANEQEWMDRAIDQVWPKYYERLGGKEQLNRILAVLGREAI